MEGLTIRRNHSGAVARYPRDSAPFAEPTVEGGVLHVPQLTDFEEFFGALFSGLQDYWWYIDGARFATPEEWDEAFDVALDRYRGRKIDEFFDQQVATCRDAFLAMPRFLESYAKYICDDWCRIVGLAARPVDVEDFLRSAAQRADCEDWLRNEWQQSRRLVAHRTVRRN